MATDARVNALVEQMREWADRLDDINDAFSPDERLSRIVREMRDVAKRREKALEQLDTTIQQYPPRRT